MKNLDILKNFTIDTLPDLDVVTLGALELFAQSKLPKVDVSEYKNPLIVGSGNAEVTGRIIFEETASFFASESNYERKLESIPSIDGVVLISASGEKHAPIIAKRAKEMGKKVTLITTNADSAAAKIADTVYAFPKNREPYTYNTSTYMGMIIGATGEDPQRIHDFIMKEVATLPLTNFNDFDTYFLIVPARFAGIVRMLNVKFIELFGRTVARDVESAENMMHATTVVPAGEVFISFGTEEERNTLWGKGGYRIHVPLPEDSGYVMMMAVSYYVIGQIQKSRPPLFKDNIVKYMKKASQVFNHELKVIVE